jgi:hypothetical protein
MTIEASVYTAIKDASSSPTRGDIVRLLRLDSESVSAALLRLTKKGWIGLSGTRNCTRYSILRDDMPKDGRGKGPGSARGRARSSKFNGEWAPKETGIPAPRPMTALEQAWGWMPLSPILPRADKSVSITGGTVRPQET